MATSTGVLKLADARFRCFECGSLVPAEECYLDFFTDTIEVFCHECGGFGSTFKDDEHRKDFVHDGCVYDDDVPF